MTLKPKSTSLRCKQTVTIPFYDEFSVGLSSSKSKIFGNIFRIPLLFNGSYFTKYIFLKSHKSHETDFSN
jgi:hypothetical protein